MRALLFFYQGASNCYKKMEMREGGRSREINRKQQSQANNGAFSPSKPVHSGRRLSVRDQFEIRQKSGRLQLEQEERRDTIMAQELAQFDRHTKEFLTSNLQVVLEPRHRFLVTQEESLSIESIRKKRNSENETIFREKKATEDAAMIAVDDVVDPMLVRLKRQESRSNHHEQTAKIAKAANQLRRLEQQRKSELIDLRAKTQAEMEYLADCISSLDDHIHRERSNPRVVTRLTAERAGKRRELDRLLELEAQWRERDEQEQQRAERMRRLRINASEVKSVIVKSMEKSLEFVVQQEEDLLDENLRRMMLTNSASTGISPRARSLSGSGKSPKSPMDASSFKSPGFEDLAEAHHQTGPCQSRRFLTLSPPNAANAGSLKSDPLESSGKNSIAASPALAPLAAAKASPNDRSPSQGSPLTSRRSRQQQAIVSDRQ